MWKLMLLSAGVAGLLPLVPVAEAAPLAQPAPAAEAGSTKLAYVIVFVADMKRSVDFYRNQVGLKLRFSSPSWSEFDTGGTILALHPKGPNNPAGTSEVGVTVRDLDAFYASRKAAGVAFLGLPKAQAYGSPLTEMRDPDGALISVGAAR